MSEQSQWSSPGLSDGIADGLSAGPDSVDGKESTAERPRQTWPIMSVGWHLRTHCSSGPCSVGERGTTDYHLKGGWHTPSELVALGDLAIFGGRGDLDTPASDGCDAVSGPKTSRKEGVLFVQASPTRFITPKASKQGAALSWNRLALSLRAAGLPVGRSSVSGPERSVGCHRQCPQPGQENSLRRPIGRESLGVRTWQSQ